MVVSSVMYGTSLSIAAIIDSRSLTANRLAHVTRLPPIANSFMRSTPGSGSALTMPSIATSRGMPTMSAIAIGSGCPSTVDTQDVPRAAPTSKADGMRTASRGSRVARKHPGNHRPTAQITET